VEIHKILVPIDFSEHSRRAVDEALGLAEKFGAELHLLHCCPLYPASAIAPYDVSLPQNLEITIHEAARGFLAEWARKAGGRGIRVEKHLSASDPATGIADLAKTLGADLIVMGTRGLTGFKHALLGSVAERTIRIAPCSVLTVKHRVDA
jgi:nucleotide-binding universal stress UspA family protein